MTASKRLIPIIILLLPVAAAAQGPLAIHGGGITIVEALYGRGDRLCDASRELARACDGRGSCEVRADNRLCGDPSPRNEKALWVLYRCGRGRESVALYPEKGGGQLFCGNDGFDPGGGAGRPPNLGRDRIHIDLVQYGAGNRFCDATPVFSRACDGRQRCEVRVNNRLCGDPADGHVKAADIFFWCNGRREHGRIREDDVAYLSCP